MRTRKITIRGGAGETLAERRKQLVAMRDSFKKRFDLNISQERMEEFIDFFQSSGIAQLDVSTAAKQWAAKSTDPVFAHLLHNRGVMATILDNQASVTGYHDTGEQPNYAIRHKGEAELILRRLSLGDNVMLRAAHLTDTQVIDESDRYWGIVYKNMLSDIMAYSADVSGMRYRRASVINRLTAHPDVACVIAVRTARGALSDLVDMFAATSSPRFCGICLHRENRRLPSGDFDQVYTISDPAGNALSNSETMFKFAATVTAYGIDTLHRDEIDAMVNRGGDPKPVNTLMRASMRILDLMSADTYYANGVNGDIVSTDEDSARSTSNIYRELAANLSRLNYVMRDQLLSDPAARRPTRQSEEYVTTYYGRPETFRFTPPSEIEDQTEDTQNDDQETDDDTEGPVNPGRLLP